MKKLDQAGSHLVAILLVIAVIGVAGFAGWRVMNADKSTNTTTNTETGDKTSTETAKSATWPMTEGVEWENTGEGGWLDVMGNAPSCPDPLMFSVPTPNLSKASAILYPGQERRGELFDGQGGNYKPHGAFRFDGLKNNQVSVTAPFDGYVYRGSRYLMDGEIQYGFDIINPCGIMVRLGHLRELSPAFQAIADKFPAAKEIDSRTEKVIPMVAVKTGDVLATAAGLPKNDNTFFDWGVYDLRKQNEAAKSAEYKQQHADASELAYYAVCWFDMVPSADSATIKSLPAGDPVNGKNSDYCK